MSDNEEDKKHNPFDDFLNELNNSKADNETMLSELDEVKASAEQIGLLLDTIITGLMKGGNVSLDTANIIALTWFMHNFK